MTWLLTRDDGCQFEFEDWQCATAAHSVLTGSRLVEKGKGMRCRAKMIDESPVTFEWVDRGGGWLPADNLLGGYFGYITEMNGEGFYVCSMVRADFGSDKRKEQDRLALERSGVDTATVEYLDTHHRPDENVLAWHWRPLFPPMIKAEPYAISTIDRLTKWNEAHSDASPNPSPAMILAGVKALEDEAWYTVGNTPGLARRVEHIWRAMEKARTRQD